MGKQQTQQGQSFWQVQPEIQASQKQAEATEEQQQGQESGEQQGGNGTQEQQGQQGQAAGEQNNGGQAGGNAEPKAPWEREGEEFDAEKAKRLLINKNADIDQLRKSRQKDIDDAVTEAEKKTVADTYAKIGKELGLVSDAPTPDELQKTIQERDSSLTDAQAKLAAQRAENVVLRKAGKHKADADALLDSRDFHTKLSKIDSAADDYADQIDALIEAETKANARYRTVQVAAANSDGGSTPTGEQEPEGELTIDQRREKRRKRRER